MPFDARTLTKPLLTGAAALALAACGSNETATTSADTDVAAADPMATDGMAMDNAAATGSGAFMTALGADPQFSTLDSAIDRAELGATLDSGTYTVFAPTDAAFQKVDKATLDGLMTPARKAELANLLKYHVVQGKVTAADLATQIKQGTGEADLTTLAGGTLKAKMQGDRVVITDGRGMTSTVTATDTTAGNSVVHGIDAVLMPAA